MEAADCQGRLPRWCSGKEPTCSAQVAGDTGSIPEMGRSPGEGIGYAVQYSWASLVGSAGKEFACNVGDLGLIPGLGNPLEEGMATHSSILAWRIPWTIPWGCKESDMTK